MEDDREQLIPFKVFGLHRTGTNLAVALITRNFQVQSLEVGAEWKHGPVKFPDRTWNEIPSRFVLCVKNPYAWLHSCYRCFNRALNSDRSVPEQFKRDPSIPFGEFVLTPSYESLTPIHRWNEMYRLWLSTLPMDRTALVRQEDQLLDQKGVLQRVQDQLGFARRKEGLQEIKGHVDIGATVSGPMNLDYYLDREYMSEYTPHLLQCVNQTLDWELMDRFRYRREESVLDQREIDGMKLVVRPLTSDAGDAREIASDPYGFEQIKSWGADIRVAIDIGAQIGAAALLIKRLWPEARVISYEPSDGNFRVLKINARATSRVAAIRAAVTVTGAATVKFSETPPMAGVYSATSGGQVDPLGANEVDAVTVEKILKQTEKLDLVKIGCAKASLSIIEAMIERQLIGKVPWICARMPSSFDRDSEVMKQLASTHAVKIAETPAGKFLLGSLAGMSRNAASRIRAGRIAASNAR